MTEESPSRVDRSRRSVLAACGTGVAVLSGLSGCAAIDLDGRDEPTYDADRLAAIIEGDLPTRPDAFPVTITDELLDRHFARARELVSAVPQRPDIPNGVVAKRLRHQRERVIDDIENGRPNASFGPWRLSRARHVRADAAEVTGVYRAATRAIDDETVAERRATLRADLRSFEADWEYRGDDPAQALVVHAELEQLRGSVRRNAEAWPPVPADPATDVFRVGDIVGGLETGRTALDDADRLRARYLDGSADPGSYRAAITAAAHRLDERASWDRRRIHGYLDTEAEDLPVGRSLEGTPAQDLYREARNNADFELDDAHRARRTGDHATAALHAATGLASLRAFEDVIDAIEDGRYGRSDDVERVATAYDDAVAALQAAWATSPVSVSTRVAGLARQALHRGHDEVERTEGYRHEINEAMAMFAYARHYAEAVPDVVSTVVQALNREL